MNFYRQLLVHLDDCASNATRLRAARTIAAEVGSSVTACYAVASSYLEAAYGIGAASPLLPRLTEWDCARRERARQTFDMELEKPGPTVSWCEVEGIGCAGEFARLALFADLLVLGQHDPSVLSGAAGDFNETVVLMSGKPGLVLPYTGWSGTVGRNVVIACKETREAARAVYTAIPLLQHAERVHVIHWAEEPGSAVGGDGKTLCLDGYLRLHGIDPIWHEGGAEPAAVGELSLSRACDLDADLLVMGCYGHSRLREIVLGGMTRTVLRSMTLPVLMAH